MYHQKTKELECNIVRHLSLLDIRVFAISATNAIILASEDCICLNIQDSTVGRDKNSLKSISHQAAISYDNSTKCFEEKEICLVLVKHWYKVDGQYITNFDNSN